jgi:hypothetical protein
MKRTGRQQQGRLRAVSRWPGAAGMSVFVPLAAGAGGAAGHSGWCRVLLVVFAAVIIGAAFAPRQKARESAVRTLDLLLRAIPGYRPPPSGTRPAPILRRPQAERRLIAWMRVPSTDSTAGVACGEASQPRRFRTLISRGARCGVSG